MSRWWRAYDEAVDDPKLIMLSDKAHRAWFNLMCLTSANGGALPQIEVIAIKLRMPEKKLAPIIEELVSRGLLDEFDGTLRPHNWNGRQYKSDVSTDRVKQFRKRQRNVSVTPPDTENRKQKEDSEASASADVVGEDPKAKLFRLGKTLLVSFGVQEKRTGALIGQWLKTRNDPIGLLGAMQFARDRNVAEPVAYISTLLKQEKPNGTAKRSLTELAFELAADARELERQAGLHRSDDVVGSH